MNREELAAAYAAPGRHYHNLAHIEGCLVALAQVERLSASEREVLSEAIWWHDVSTIRSASITKSSALDWPNGMCAPISAARSAA